MSARESAVRGSMTNAQYVDSARPTASRSRSARVAVREAGPGDGTAVATLCHELCVAHDAWGGYPSLDDPSVYAELARQLDATARARACRGVLHPNLRLVAETGGALVGQIEGQLERHGIAQETPFTCSFRSLIVTG